LFKVLCGGGAATAVATTANSVIASEAPLPSLRHLAVDSIDPDMVPPMPPSSYDITSRDVRLLRARPATRTSLNRPHCGRDCTPGYGAVTYASANANWQLMMNFTNLER
jgi:hypothetical protein